MPIVSRGLAHSCAKIDLLLVGKVTGHAVEPGVDRRLVDILFDVPALVEQRHDRLVADRIAH